MWPRNLSDDEPRKRQKICAFISYNTKAEAVRAKETLNGKDILDINQPLQIGWAKNKNPPSQQNKSSNFSNTGPISQPTSTNTVFGIPLQPNTVMQTLINITPPTDISQQQLIDRLASYIVKEGAKFENMIMEKEKNNSRFQFLFQPGSPENIYYTWRVYSLSKGDTLEKWRVEPFQMVAGGPTWIPPNPVLMQIQQQQNPIPPIKEEEKNIIPAISTEKKEDSKVTIGKFKEKGLTPELHEDFEIILKLLSIERKKIKEAMAFIIENSEYWSEITTILCESILLPGQLINKKSS